MRKWISPAIRARLSRAFLGRFSLLVPATPGMSQESRGNGQLEWLT